MAERQPKYNQRCQNPAILWIFFRETSVKENIAQFIAELNSAASVSGLVIAQCNVIDTTLVCYIMI